MESEVLVSFQCTVKLHFAGGTRHPVQHSCKLSLAVLGGSQPCFMLEGAGMGKLKKMKFSRRDLKSVAATRINEGRLSVTVYNQEWDTIVLTDVQDRRSLGQLHRQLEGLFHGTFPAVIDASGRGPVVGQTPPPLVLNRRSPSEQQCLSVKKKRAYSLIPHPRNWRGASMVAAAKSNNKSTPSNNYKTNSFYGSPADSSLPPTLLSSGERSGANKSAKRMLVLDSAESDDFLPSPNFRPPRDSTPKTQRPPLGTLSTVPQVGNVARGNSASVTKGNGRLEQLLRSEADPDGFANLGNTCYMNAVLQSLLGLYPFAEDLLSPQLVRNVHPNSLYRMVVMLLKCKRCKDSFENQRILLKKIKSTISVNTLKFVGFRQQDAHELLSMCLDQLKDDAQHVGNHGNDSSHGNTGSKNDTTANSTSPIVMNFESNIEHKIVCKECGHVTRTSQVGYDFSLQLPKRVHHKHIEQANLQLLFDQFFEAEEVEFNCTSCGCQTATLSLQLARLPRIMILHLKRYGYNYQLSENSKRVDNIRIPRYINVGHMAKTQYEPPPLFTASTPRDPHSPVLEEKENLLTNSTDTAHHTQGPAHHIQDSAYHTQLPIVSHESTLQSKSSIASNDSNHITLTPPHTPTRPRTTAHTVTKCTTQDSAIVILDSDDEAKTETTKTTKQTDFKDANFQPIAVSDQTTTSLLGKRKISNRYSELEETQHTSINVSMESLTDDSGTATSYCSDTKDLLNEDPVNSDSGIGMESIRTGTESSVVVGSNARLGMSEEEAQRIRDQSLAEIDAMLATVPLEELTGFPIVQPSQLITPSRTIVTAQPPGNSDTGTISPDICASYDTSVLDTNAYTTCTSVLDTSETNLPVENTKEQKSPAAADGDLVPVMALPEVKGYLDEQEDFERAVRESLQTQGSEFQLEGLSEEEQLRLALELSIQDSISAEATPTPSPCPQGNPLPRLSATPTPEKLSTETYRLVSIVNHIGRGSAGGHYISDVYSFPDHSWRTYNDSQVSEVKEEDIRQRRQTTGYIFFYLHRSIFTNVSAQFGR